LTRSMDRPEGNEMDSTAEGAALTDCVVPLDEEGRRAVRRYWDRVIREEMRAATSPGAVSA